MLEKPQIPPSLVSISVYKKHSNVFVDVLKVSESSNLFEFMLALKEKKTMLKMLPAQTLVLAHRGKAKLQVEKQKFLDFCDSEDPGPKPMHILASGFRHLDGSVLKSHNLLSVKHLIYALDIWYTRDLGHTDKGLIDKLLE